MGLTESESVMVKGWLYRFVLSPERTLVFVLIGDSIPDRLKVHSEAYKFVAPEDKVLLDMYLKEKRFEAFEVPIGKTYSEYVKDHLGLTYLDYESYSLTHSEDEVAIGTYEELNNLLVDLNRSFGSMCEFKMSHNQETGRAKISCKGNRRWIRATDAWCNGWLYRHRNG